jgi:hypothetical protein
MNRTMSRTGTPLTRRGGISAVRDGASFRAARGGEPIIADRP